ncbi:MAG: hypothetical protein NT000_05535 [Proteobacteria bacterium]|nr:hypothetical protein [Pseudomonadota bacterium]NQW44376.1 hypothetical protein [Deltaproteobacteria bacterium]
MKTCKICGGPKSNYVLNNRTVCMKCDELVFDVEIECDEDEDRKKNRVTDKSKIDTTLRKTHITVKK